MKKCPYCAEEILDEAVVCKHCGRDLDDPGKYKKKNPTIGGLAFIALSIGLAMLLITGDINNIPALAITFVSLIVLVYALATGQIKYFG